MSYTPGWLPRTEREHRRRVAANEAKEEADFFRFKVATAAIALVASVTLTLLFLGALAAMKRAGG